MEKLTENMRRALEHYGEVYGKAGFVAAALVVAKTIVFYMLMGTASHFVSVCLLTLLFTFLLFSAFRNKWIPAVIFLLLSFLMFCDVTYSSFFNRYLSVGMIGAAEVVGDIGASIREVLRPINFFMLADALFIAGMLAYRQKLAKQGAAAQTEAVEMQAAEAAEMQGAAAQTEAETHNEAAGVSDDGTAQQISERIRAAAIRAVEKMKAAAAYLKAALIRAANKIQVAAVRLKEAAKIKIEAIRSEKDEASGAVAEIENAETESTETEAQTDKTEATVRSEAAKITKAEVHSAVQIEDAEVQTVETEDAEDADAEVQTAETEDAEAQTEDTETQTAATESAETAAQTEAETHNEAAGASDDGTAQQISERIRAAAICAAEKMKAAAAHLKAALIRAVEKMKAAIAHWKETTHAAEKMKAAAAYLKAAAIRATNKIQVAAVRLKEAAQIKIEAIRSEKDEASGTVAEIENAETENTETEAQAEDAESAETEAQPEDTESAEAEAQTDKTKAIVRSKAAKVTKAEVHSAIQTEDAEDADAEVQTAVAEVQTEEADGQIAAAEAQAEDAESATRATDTIAQRMAMRARKRAMRKGFRIALAFLLILATLCLNVFSSSYVQSVSNQEFYTFHVKDIFASLFGNGSGGRGSENLKAWTNSYEQEKIGPLFGAAEGKNLIMIQIESLQDFVIGLEYNGQEITPNLNALLKSNATYFDNFYQQIGSGNTSDAEFAANNSLYGTLVSYTYKLFNENYFRGMPVLLSEKGYDTAVFHAHENRSFWSREKMYPSEGFKRYYGGLAANGGDYEMTEWMGWGLTDSEFFPQTAAYMKELTEPFYSFVITISNHHPYEMLDKYKLIELAPEDEDTIVGKYLQSAAYTDYALGVFFDELKKAGLYDDSLFVFYGDHTGLTHSEEIDAGMEKILGKPYDFEEMLKVPLIIYTPDETVDLRGVNMTAGGETDIMPTVAYLLGVDRLDTVYTGHNLYTVGEGFVAEQTYMTKGSFFTNDVAYEMARDGVFANGRAWNIHTGEPVSVDLCYEGYLRSLDIVNTSEYVLRSDAIRTLFLEGGSLKSVDRANISRIYPAEIVNAGYPEEELLGTNSAEALNASVNAGYRTLRLDVFWDEDSRPYTKNKLTDEVEMDDKDIIGWMEDHAAIDLVFNMEKSADFMMKYCGTIAPSVLDRIILEVPNAEEYTGRYEAILDLTSAGLTAEEAMEFVDSHKVWAVMMNGEEAEGRFAELLEGEAAVYIRDEDTGHIAKFN